MFEDLAALGISINAKSADVAAGSLDGLTRSGAKTETQFDKTAKAATLFGSVLAGLAIAKVVSELSNVTDATIKFNRAIADISTQADTATFSMAKLQKASLDQARAFNSQPLEQSKALYDIISAGADSAADAVNTLTAANKLAVGGNTDVATAADGLTSVLNAYGNKVKSVTAVSDTLFIANKIGKTTIDELASSIGNVAPIASAMGVSFNDLAIAAGALTSQGIKTDVAMTGLRAILSSVAKPSEEATKLAKALGLEYNSAGLQAKGFAGFLADLQEKTGGNTDALAVLTGGVESLLPTLALLGPAADTFKQGLQSVQTEADATDKALNKVTSSGAFQFEQMMGTVSKTVFEVAVSLLDKLTPALTYVNGLLQGTTAPITAVDVALKALAITAGVLTVRALGGAAISFVLASNSVRAYALSVALVGPAAATATVATTALGAAVRFALGPIGLAITAVTLLATAWEFHKTTQEKAKTANEQLYKLIAENQGLIQLSTANTSASAEAKLHEVEATRNQIQAELELARVRAKQAYQGFVGSTQVGGERAEVQSMAMLQQMTVLQQQIDDAEKAINENLEAQKKLRGDIVNLKADEAKAADKALADAKKAAEVALKLLQIQTKPTPKTDAEKEYDRQERKSKDYLLQLEKETAEVGASAIEQKKWEIAKQASLAPNDALTASIKAQGKALLDKLNTQLIIDMKKPYDNERRSLEQQLSLVNMTNRERAIAQARLEAQIKLEQEHVDLQSEGAKSIIAAAEKNASLQADLSEGIGDNIKQAQRLADVYGSIADQMRTAGQAFGDAFGPVGKSIAGVTEALADLQAQQASFSAKLLDVRKVYGEDSAEYQRTIEERKAAEIHSYGDMAAAAKSFFKEKSDGYKVVATAEKIFRTIEFAMSVKSIAVKAAETAAKLPMFAAQAIAAAQAGAANMFATLGPLGFAAVAAMGVVLASWGLKGGGSSAGSIPTAQDRQDAQGTGSVFGSSSVKSDSLAKSLEIARSYQNKDLEYSNQMVKSLKAIQDGIGNVAAALVRSLSAGGSLDTSNLGLGTTSSGPGVLTKLFAPISNLLPGLFGSKKTTTLLDQGLSFGTQSLSDLLSGGINGSTYQDVQTQKKKKAFGITYSNKTSTNTVTGQLDSDLAGEITDLIGGLRDNVLIAAKSLGLDGAQAVLDSFQVSLGTLSFKDMTADQITDALNAVFSKLSDQMAEAVGGSLIDQFQQVGEGALETLTRIARGVQVFDTAMQAMGKTFSLTGLAGIEAKQNLIDLMGGLEDFVDKTNAYADAFLTDAEKNAAIQRSVTEAMTSLGLAGITTKDGFKALVSGLDLTTQGGQELYAQLLDVAPAFAKAADAAEDAASSLLQAAQDNLDAANKAVSDAMTALRNAYQQELEAATGQLDSATQELADAHKDLAAIYAYEVQMIQDRIAAAEELVNQSGDELANAYNKRVSELNDKVAAAQQNVLNATDALSGAYDRQSTIIVDTMSRFRAFAANLREFKQSIVSGPLAGLSPQASYQAAKSLFEDVADKAKNGNEEAIGQLQGVSESYLEASKAYYASSQGYFDDLTKVKNAVETAEQYANSQVDISTQQLNAINKVYDGIDGVYDGVVALNGGILTLQDGVFKTGDNVSSVEDAVKALKVAVLNRDATASEAKAQLDALNTAIDGLDGVIDGIAVLGGQTYTLTQTVLGTAQNTATSIVNATSLQTSNLTNTANANASAYLKGLLGQTSDLNAGVAGVTGGQTSSLLGGLTGQTGSLNAQVLSASNTNASAIVAGIGAQNATVNTSVFTVGTKVSSVETAITKLQAALANAADVKAQSQAELNALNKLYDGVDGVVDGLVNVNGSVLILKDGVFQSADLVTKNILALGDRVYVLKDGVFQSADKIAGSVGSSAGTISGAVNNSAGAIAGAVNGNASVVAGAVNNNTNVIAVYSTAVANAVDRVKAAAVTQAQAQSVVDKLQAQVQPLLNIDNSVKSVNQAVIDLKAAQTDATAMQNLYNVTAAAQTAAVAAAQAAQAQAIVDAIAKANNTTSTPVPDSPLTQTPTAAVNWDSYLTHYPDVMSEYNRLSKNNLRNNYGIYTPQQFAEWHYSSYGKSEGRVPYAHGGIIDRPMTLGESGIGGEAGEEGILPLQKVGGKLGVNAKVGLDDPLMKEILKALLGMLQELKADKTQREAIAKVTLAILEELTQTNQRAMRNTLRQPL